MKVVQQAEVTFGRFGVKTMKFTATKKRVKVRCTGLPSMVIVPREVTRKDMNPYLAYVIDKEGKQVYVTGKTPRAAYRQGVTCLWKPILRASA